MNIGSGKKKHQIKINIQNFYKTYKNSQWGGVIANAKVVICVVIYAIFGDVKLANL